MSRIAVVAKANNAELFGALRRVMPAAGVFDIKNALATGAPLIDREITGDDWEEAHAQVRAVVAELKHRAVPFTLFELRDDQTPESAPYNRIDETALENILDSFPNEARDF